MMTSSDQFCGVPFFCGQKNLFILIKMVEGSTSSSYTYISQVSELNAEQAFRQIARDQTKLQAHHLVPLFDKFVELEGCKRPHPVQLDGYKSMIQDTVGLTLDVFKSFAHGYLSTLLD